jgi:AcrR family transcriptional regulator
MRIMRRSAAAVEDTRRTVLGKAVLAASVSGLDGLTIGPLADEAEMSKSGLFGLFGSKLELQLAVLRAGIETFTREVWEPVAEMPRGRERLLALCERWIDFHRRGVFPGGCFMTTAIVEWDSRPGPMRDAVRKAQSRWLSLLAGDAEAAIGNGQLPAGSDPADVAFSLNALAAAGSSAYQLSGEKLELERALRCMRGVLAAP